MKSFQYPTVGDVVLLERLVPNDLFPENPFGYLGVVNSQVRDTEVDVGKDHRAYFTLGQPGSLVSIAGTWRIIDNFGPLEDTPTDETAPSDVEPEEFSLEFFRGTEGPVRTGAPYGNFTSALNEARQRVNLYQNRGIKYLIRGTVTNEIYWTSDHKGPILDTATTAHSVEPDGYVIQFSRGGGDRPMPTGNPYTDLSKAVADARDKAKTFGWRYLVRGVYNDILYWDSDWQTYPDKSVQESLIAPVDTPDLRLVQQRITVLAERLATLEDDVSKMKKTGPEVAQKHGLPTPQQLQQSREALAVEHYGQVIVSDLKNAAENLSSIATRIDEWEDRVLNTALVRDEEDLAEARSAFDKVEQCAAEIEDAAEEMANQIKFLNIKPPLQLPSHPQKDSYDLYLQACLAWTKLSEIDKRYRYHSWPLVQHGKQYTIDDILPTFRTNDLMDIRGMARRQSSQGKYTLVYDSTNQAVISLFHNGEEIK